MLAAALLLPAFAAVVVPLLGRDGLARVATLAVMLAVLWLAVTLVLAFDGAGTMPQFVVDAPWMPALGVHLRFGVDGFNVYLLLLTALLFPVVLACAWHADEGRSPLYLALMLLLEAALLGTFLAQDLLVLFVLWEAVLIPMVLLILVFGGPGRRRAAMTFFLYTMAGSVLFLAAVILLGTEQRAADRAVGVRLREPAVAAAHAVAAAFVFVAIALACAVKSPLFPFHAWLPLAYGEASASGTALMAGVLSKMGAYGFVRLAVPLCPDVAPALAPLLMALRPRSASSTAPCSRCGSGTTSCWSRTRR